MDVAPSVFWPFLHFVVAVVFSSLSGTHVRIHTLANCNEEMKTAFHMTKDGNLVELDTVITKKFL